MSKNKRNMSETDEQKVIDFMVETESDCMNDETSDMVETRDIYFNEYFNSLKTRVVREHPVAVRRTKKVLTGAAAVAGSIICSILVKKGVDFITKMSSSNNNSEDIDFGAETFDVECDDDDNNSDVFDVDYVDVTEEQEETEENTVE